VTRILRIETCDAPCPHAVGTRGCRHPNSLWDDEGITRIRPFEDYPLIPAWCPLEQAGPDWQPPGKPGATSEVQAPSCPKCGAAMVADRQITFFPRPFPGRTPPPPRPIWLCRTCGMRIDREEVLPGLDFPVRGGTAPGSGQKPARRERG
jgi:hypothetical protein